MRVTKRDIAVYIVVLMAALALQSTFAQSVPEIVDGKWVLPANDASAAPAGQYSGGGYEAVAYEACAYHGCSGDYLISIMNCESGQNPNAYHPNPYGGADIGIMQINDATWGSIAYAGPVEQIWWAADMIAAGMGYHWSCG